MVRMALIINKKPDNYSFKKNEYQKVGFPILVEFPDPTKQKSRDRIFISYYRHEFILHHIL